MTDPQAPQDPPEENLHELSDEDYFTAIEEMPPAYDAEGNEVSGLFEDVVDARESKARAAEAARRKENG